MNVPLNEDDLIGVLVWTRVWDLVYALHMYALIGYFLGLFYMYMNMNEWLSDEHVLYA